MSTTFFSKILPFMR